MVARFRQPRYRRAMLCRPVALRPYLSAKFAFYATEYAATGFTNQQTSHAAFSNCY